MALYTRIESNKQYIIYKKRLNNKYHWNIKQNIITQFPFIIYYTKQRESLIISILNWFILIELKKVHPDCGICKKMVSHW